MKRNANTRVACYDKDGKLVKTYPSAKKAAEARKLYPRTIDRCIRGDIKTVKGYRWKRYKVGEVEKSIEPLKITTTNLSIKPICKINDSGKILEVYSSIKEASRKNKLDAHSIRDRLNNKYKYAGKAKFRYLTEEEISRFGLKKGEEIEIIIRPINQYNLKGDYIKTYPSIRAALLALNKSEKSNSIKNVLKGKSKSAYGYIWKYQGEEISNLPKINHKYIYVYDQNNKLIYRFSSVKEASENLNLGISTINNAIRLNRKAKGYRWKRK